MKKILTLLALMLLPLPALAFTHQGDELEPLTFGQGIITDNSAARSCTIPAGGTETCDAEITLLNAGHYGVFRLSDYDPTITVEAHIDDSTLTASGGQVFDIKDFTFSPNISDSGGVPAQPDADGSLTLMIGATLRTRAGVTYDSTTYRGTYTLQISY
jgi:hypothetical protein